MNEEPFGYRVAHQRYHVKSCRRLYITFKKVIKVVLDRGLEKILINCCVIVMIITLPKLHKAIIEKNSKPYNSSLTTVATSLPL